MRERKKGRMLNLGNKNNCSLICGNLESRYFPVCGCKREHNHQGEKRALGKIKWNGRNNDSKKSKSSAQELMVDQGSSRNMRNRTCYKCVKIGHIALDCKIGKVCYGCRFPDHIRPNYPCNKVNNNQHMVVGKGNRLGDVMT
uniref:CCHC-type domain-containing protein n=1 Tax=Lactuca sativa TaxID=4236 RepID=A0A9R1XKV4_LACSA|nr:hypothetical protein LSAT_V11C300144740 [Lactuca sativa]